MRSSFIITKAPCHETTPFTSLCTIVYLASPFTSGGIYTLLSVTSLSGGTTLSATSTSVKYTVVPFIDGNVLKAEVFPDALMIFLR